MGLLSGYLVQLFADAGLADRDAAWSDNDDAGRMAGAPAGESRRCPLPADQIFWPSLYIFGKKCAFAGDA